MTSTLNIGGVNTILPRKDKPALSPIINTEDLLDAVNDLAEHVALLSGQNQDALERAVTFKDLQESGVDVAGVTALGVGGGIGFPAPPTELPDLSVPPAVSGFYATATFENVLLFWDAATYRNHAYVEIWRAPAWQDEAKTIPTNIGDAKYLVSNPTTAYADKGLPQDEFRYWIRNVSDTDIKGPFSGPVYVQLATKPSYLIEKISGEIRESDLYIDLGNKIDGSYVEIYGANGQGDTEGLVFDVDALQFQLDDPTTGLEARFGTLDGIVTDPTTGLVDVVSQLDLQLNDPTTGVETRLLATAQVGTDNAGVIAASYTVKIDAGGRISGFGLMDSGSSSEFAVRADRFWIAHPESDASPTSYAIPFIIDNGNVLIDNAFINTAYIESLIAAEVTADYINALTINAIEITGGEITIGNDFSVDVAGLMYSKNAFIESGTLKAMQILDASNNVIMTSGGGFNGAYINNLSVDTLKLANNAVTVPRFMEGSTYVDSTGGVIFDQTYSQGQAAWIMADMTVEATRVGDDSSTNDRINLYMSLYEAGNGTPIETITHLGIFADNVGGTEPKHLLPISGAAYINNTSVRITVSAYPTVVGQGFTFKATGFSMSAKK